MRTDLSSSLTFIYKIVFPTIWTLIILGLATFMLWDSQNPWTLTVLLMLLPMLILVKIQEVSYDDKYVYVSNWRTKTTYELKDVKSINEADMMSFDPFFEIEIIDKDGKLKKVDFMPKVFEQLTFMFTKKYTGQLLDIKTKIINRKKEFRETAHAGNNVLVPGGGSVSS